MKLPHQEIHRIIKSSEVELQTVSYGSGTYFPMQTLLMPQIEQLVQAAFNEGRKYERNQERND